MKSLLIILIFLSLVSCSSNSKRELLLERLPASDDENCFAIAERLIASPNIQPKTENEIKWENFYNNKVTSFYKQKWDSFSRFYYINYWQLKQEKSPIIDIFEKLGFEVHPDKIIAPDLETFITKYEIYLDSKNISQTQRIMPALSYLKKNGGPEEVLLNIPKRDSVKVDTDVWAPKLGLRLNDNDIVKNIAEGRFPLFTDGFHDVYHLITFAMYPEYAEALRLANKELVKNPNKAFYTRSGYTLEVLTLADTNKLPEILANLTIKNPKKTLTFDNFLEAVNLLPDEKLNEKSEFWVKNYQNFLIHYAGGMAESIEKKTYAKRLGEGDNKLFNHFYRKTFSKDKAVPDEMLTEGMSHMDKILEELLNSSKKKMPSFDSFYLKNGLVKKDEIHRLIQLQVARMEYSLWKSGTQIDLKQWSKDILQPSVDSLSPSMMFIKDSFGANSLTYHLFLQEN